MRAPSELEPRPVDREDLPAVAALLREGWPGVDWVARFRRMWFENPNWGPDTELGWSHFVEGRPRSFFGGLPLAYRLRGEDVRASAATSLFVHPEHRRQGWSEALVRAWLGQAKPRFFVNSTSNLISENVFVKLGLQEQSRSGQREGSLVASALAQARRAARLRTEALPLGFVLRQPLAVLGALALRLRGQPRFGDCPWTWEKLEQGDERIDRLWERERDRCSATLCRDRQQTSWLYFEGPNAGHNHLLLASAADGTPKALAGLWEDHEKSQLRHVDLFGALESTSDLHGFLSLSLELGRQAGLGALRVRLPAAFANLGNPLEAIDWQPCAGRVFYRAVGQAAGTLEPFLTDLDGDRCLDL